ncbi:MAG TPA: hypothetical protein PKC72_15980 [Chitinophagaceae bacterium]|nr:hypothetical protein [Chitinophagaceae bacterium]
MKILLTTALLFLGHLISAQTEDKEYIEVNFYLPWKSAKISLTKESDNIYTTTTDSATVLVYQDLEPGYYKLSATGSDNLSEVRDSILIKPGQKINAGIVFSEKCDFDYPATYIPTCPAEHKDGILEIRYRNENIPIKGRKYYLVTYTATGCIPRYYCTRHDIKF